MSEEQILKRAIEKAHKNGWISDWRKGEFEVAIKYWNLPKMVFTKEYYSYIFSHDFAKAFWGEEMTSSLSKPRQRVWQYHLQQLVLEEEPLKYLEKFLK